MQTFTTCESLSNLSQKQIKAKSNTAARKNDALQKLIMCMTPILNDALPTWLPRSKHKLSGKKLRNVVLFLLGTPREVRHGIVGLYALSHGRP